MSSSPADEMPVRGLTLYRYVLLSAFTILMHEHCLTFILEVERFWRRRKATWVAFFFFLNRYFVPLGFVPVLLQGFWYLNSPNKEMICDALRLYHHLYVLVVQIVVSAMLIIRTYALYERSRRILALTTSLILAVTGFACWSIFSRKKEDVVEYFNTKGCASTISQTEAKRYAQAWGGLLVFDTLIFALTVYKSLLSLRRGRGSSLLTLMLRDGSMYFGVIVACNVANILTFLYGGPFTKGSGSTFVNNVSSAMITRLMLHMRDPKLCEVSGSSQPKGISFRSSQNFSTLADNARTEIEDRTYYSSHFSTSQA